MKKKLIIVVVISIILVLIPITLVRFYNINDTKEFTSIEVFEEETQLEFHDLYNVDTYLLSNEKVKLSDETDLKIQFDINSKDTYKMRSESLKYPFIIDEVPKEVYPDYYKTKKINNIEINYVYYPNENQYEFCVIEKEFQYKFRIIDNIESEDKLFLKIKNYILLNKKLIEKL